MMRVNSALRVSSSFGPLPSPELKDSALIYREVTAADQTHAACHKATGSRAIRRNYPVCFVLFEMGECPRFFFPEGPGLAWAIEVAIALQIFLKAPLKTEEASLV